jgi:C-terminal processing protease CtpA/Prc
VHTVDLSDQLAQYFHIKDGRGVLVKEVIEDSPAEKAGLKAGDVIIKTDGERIEDTPDLHQVIGGHEEGEDMELVVVRGGKEKKLTATLEEPPFHGADKLAKKLKKLPGKKAPCHERMKVKVPLHELKDIRVEVIKELDELDIQELEDRLDKLEEELDLIKEKIETD